MLPYLDYVCIGNKIYDRESEINDNVVDRIHCRNVIHHINDLLGLFTNFYRYLKEDGELEIIECTKESYQANYFLDTLWYRYVIPRKEVWFADKYRDYISIAKQIGFKVKTVDTVNEKEHYILTRK